MEAVVAKARDVDVSHRQPGAPLPQRTTGTTQEIRARDAAPPDDHHNSDLELTKDSQLAAR